MSYTTISEVFQSEGFADYARERTVALNALVQSGAMITDPKYDALIKDRAFIVEMPFWKPLDGDDEVITDSAPLSVGALENGKQLAVKLIRGKAFGMTDLAGMATGENKEKLIAEGLAEFWNKKINNIITAELNGLFAANGALKSHLLDESNSVISGEFMTRVLGKMGDHYKNLTFVVMHSAIYHKLRELQLIDNIPDATNPAGSFESWQGKRVIVDDACTVNNGVYDTYMFGAGAFGFGSGAVPDENLPEYEIVRDGLGSKTAVVSRRCMIIHPVGFQYKGQNITSTTTPTNANLATANKWELVYDHKNIPMVCLICRAESEESES